MYVDGRPHQSHNVVDGSQLTLGHPQEFIRVEGYQGANLKQVRTIRLTGEHPPALGHSSWATVPGVSAPLCVIGDFAWDVSIRTNSELLRGGDTFGEVMLTPGGSAANVAVWAARCGVDDRVHRQDRPRSLRVSWPRRTSSRERRHPLRRDRRAPHRIRRRVRRPHRRALDGVGPRRRLLPACHRAAARP